jgi:hypothetical protein
MYLLKKKKVVNSSKIKFVSKRKNRERERERVLFGKELHLPSMILSRQGFKEMISTLSCNPCPFT